MTAMTHNRAERLLRLADACEKASGPDQHIDADIRKVMNVTYGLGSVPPFYTASLDAAMTLVPEGWRPVIDMASEEGAALVDLWAWVTVRPKPERYHAKAATPTLALCAAALRARSSGDAK